jgi:hypothetical protein
VAFPFSHPIFHSVFAARLMIWFLADLGVSAVPFKSLDLAASLAAYITVQGTGLI